MTERGTLHRAWRLSVVRRHGQLAITLIGKNSILEVLRFPTRGEELESSIRMAVTSVATDYAVSRIIVEPGSLVEAILKKTTLTVVTLTIGDAALSTLPKPVSTLREIYRSVIEEAPVLARYVTVLRATDEVASSPDERWRTVVLLAALLGLGDAARNPS